MASLDNRDSVYTSMPELRDSSPSLCPHDGEDECPLSSSGHSETDEPCHKSIGDSVQPASYYHISESCSGHGFEDNECQPPDELLKCPGVFDAKMLDRNATPQMASHNS
ncbi:hypothetical protein PHYPO_G00190510 [Pangasianodon hypophthalmus]|uniref:GPCR family 2 latrophilin C-terminal domain-containing protein n=1 Tax=Pangasianodon hypophthalmus TaxID=310915 RepID=A0A5N5PHR1_PANHP|nr:hypothetical protein PHYPO_G00190510 [Pangasianodon hypophthalmus]